MASPHNFQLGIKSRLFTLARQSLAAGLMVLTMNATAQTITTVVGGGVGDGGPAIGAVINSPVGVAVDSQGNLYIGDTNNHRVRKVAANGTITTVAGNGRPGYSGDSGAATNAHLNSPRGVAIDSAGNLYIADMSSHRVRRVTPGGVISTVAGTGSQGFSGDGGPATSARLSDPFSLVLDSANNLYIATYHRVRKVDANGVITTVAGNGTQGFSGDGGPAVSASFAYINGMAFDGAGNLYLVDGSNYRLRKVDTNGVVTTVAGNGTQGFSGDGGPATSASFHTPTGLTAHADGTLYVSDYYGQRIRKITPGGIISTVAGTGTGGFIGDGGPATGAKLYNPSGLALDSAGNVYIADNFNYRIRKITTDGNIGTVAGNGTAAVYGDGGPATDASLSSPTGIAFDGAGNLYIADQNNYRVRKVTPGGVISTVAGHNNPAVHVDGVPATSAFIQNPRGVAVDSAGNLYIAEANGPRVRKVDVNGVISTVAGNGISGFSGDGGPAASASLHYPVAVAVDGAGNLYISDHNNHRVRKVATNGTIITVAGNGSTTFNGDGGAATGASISSPIGLAFDSAGNLYIADASHNRVRKVTPGGIISTVAGNGTYGFSGDGGLATNAPLASPNGVAVDAAGNIYVSVVGSYRVRKVAPNGIISTVAGNGSTIYFGGDGGPAINASFSFLAGLAVDATGNLYITDMSSNHRIRKVTLVAPYVPVIGTAVAGDGQISVAFTTLDGGFGVLDYTATCGGQSVAGTSSPIVVTGLTNGTSYTCAVSARNALGTSAASLPSNSVTPKSPSVTTLTGPATSTYGNYVHFTVTVTGTSPTGTIAVKDGSTTLFYCSLLTLNAGSALCVSQLSAGTRSLTATYSGDGVNQPSVSAIFTHTVTVMRTLTAARSGTGQGSVSSTPSGITCGADCSEAYESGTSINLNAAPAPGSVFAGWNGVTCNEGAGSLSCTFTLNSDLTATAAFGRDDPAFGDFNADNKPDLLWRHTPSGALYVWYMNGLSLISDALITTVDPSWKLDGIADFNGDGHPDIVWRNGAGDTYVWYLVNGVFQSDAFLFSLPPEWVIQGVADFNADGKPDFLMRNTNSGNAFVWFFNNNVAIGDQFLFNIDPSWKVEGVADLNADGQPDLLFRNVNSGLAFAWNSQFSGGNLTLTTSSPPIFSIDSFWEVVQVADWNNDNKPDLLFRNRNTGVVFVWYMDGVTLTTSDFIIQIDPSWEIVPRRPN